MALWWRQLSPESHLTKLFFSVFETFSLWSIQEPGSRLNVTCSRSGVEITAPEYLPAVVTSPDTAGWVYLTVRLYSALRKCSLHSAQCSALLAQGEGLCPAQPWAAGLLHTAPTALLWYTNISKELLSTLLTTLTCANQGSCDLDMA